MLSSKLLSALALSGIIFLSAGPLYAQNTNQGNGSQQTTAATDNRGDDTDHHGRNYWGLLGLLGLIGLAGLSGQRRTNTTTTTTRDATGRPYRPAE